MRQLAACSATDTGGFGVRVHAFARVGADRLWNEPAQTHSPVRRWEGGDLQDTAGGLTADGDMRRGRTMTSQPWARFDDLRAGTALAFQSTSRVLVAHRPADVIAVLDEVERATAAG